MKHYYEDVPDLGNVAISRHAQANVSEQGITEQQFEDALLKGKTIPDTHEACFREYNGVRLVIVHKPTPFRGAKLVTTTFRIQAQKKAKM